MRPIISLRAALSDSTSLAKLSGNSWRPWKITQIAAMGEPLTDPSAGAFPLH